MHPDYKALFEQTVAYRIIEKRSRVLDSLISNYGLSKPLSIECRPLPWCEPQRCFVNVDQQIKTGAGTMLTGWIFEEFEDRLVKGVAHGIWVSISGKRLDVTPHRFQPERIIFCPDTRVATKRGYTTPPKILISTDSRVIAIEEFETEFDRILETRFVAFDSYIDISKADVRSAADKVGLPHDVAFHLVDIRLARKLA